MSPFVEWGKNGEGGRGGRKFSIYRAALMDGRALLFDHVSSLI